MSKCLLGSEGGHNRGSLSPARLIKGALAARAPALTGSWWLTTGTLAAATRRRLMACVCKQDRGGGPQLACKCRGAQLGGREGEGKGAGLILKHSLPPKKGCCSRGGDRAALNAASPTSALLPSSHRPWPLPPFLSHGTAVGDATGSSLTLTSL